MEISAALKSDIKSVQGEMTKFIQDHQNLALKLKEFPDLESQIKQDLVGIQKQIVELNDRQKVLLQQLRKEIEENINNGQFVPVFNFNLYKIKPGQLESKKRRRKDLSLAPKVVACRPTHSPPSLSPSPTPSSSSSLSNDSVEYMSPFMLPVPVPKARPMLLPDVRENVYLGSVSRRDLRPPKLKRNQKPLSDEEVFKDIPVYYDPLPSPPPTDEKDLKARFMTALSLIPKEMLHEILNRKVERKRRSTATNNPNFVYNNDWEIPAWKRSRTYLSPHKIGKMESSGKKIKVEDSDSGLSSKHGKKERDLDCDKSGRLYMDDVKLSGLSVDKVESKSRNSTPDSTSSNMLCFVCHTSGLLNVCKDCSVCYHLSCISPNSSVSCPCCKHKRSSPDDGSSEESSKEEFVSKCPNIAESYNKLKEYIENHTDSDTAALYTERDNFKMELIAKNQELYGQKRELEEKAAELSEALLLQEDAKNNLLKEEEKLLAKIKVIVDFVTLYQKTNENSAAAKENPNETETNTATNENSNLATIKEEEVEEDEQGDSNQVEREYEEEEEEEQQHQQHQQQHQHQQEEEDDDGDQVEGHGPSFQSEAECDETTGGEETGKIGDDEDNNKCGESRESPESWKESCDNSQTNYFSPERFSQEDSPGPGSPGLRSAYENCDSSSQMSKESLVGHDGGRVVVGSPRTSSKDSLGNALFELDEGDDQFTSQSIECSAESEGVDYESSIE